MRLSLFSMKDPSGNFAAYGTVVRDGETVSDVEEILILGATPEIAGVNLTILLLQLKENEATP